MVNDHISKCRRSLYWYTIYADDRILVKILISTLYDHNSQNQTHLSIYPSIHLFIFLSIYLSICRSILPVLEFMNPKISAKVNYDSMSKFVTTQIKQP